jgi:acyl-CoA thioesterase
MPAFVQHFRYCWEDCRHPFSGSAEPISSGWCRHRGPTGSPHAAVVGLLDAWPAPLLTMGTVPFPASTVSWTASFVDVPPDSDPDGWWYFRATVRHSADGHATTEGRLYAPDGRLAAHMDQLVVIFDA